MRRLAAAGRALDRERTRLALFVCELLGGQETPEERIRRYDECLFVQDRQHRELAAKQWRRGRKLLAKAPQETREEILAAWNRSSIPTDAAYFTDFVWSALRDRGLLTSQGDNS
jgi:hypothetical protein